MTITSNNTHTSYIDNTKDYYSINSYLIFATLRYKAVTAHIIAISNLYINLSPRFACFESQLTIYNHTLIVPIG